MRSGSWYGPGVWIDFFFSTLTASGGCNMASGASWSIEGGVLKVDHDYGNTLIGCGPSADAQDHWWINLLNASPAAQWDSVNRLVILSGDTFVTMVEWPKETPIGGRPAH